MEIERKLARILGLDALGKAPCFQTIPTRFLSWEPGKGLKAEMAVPEGFFNASGRLQGGFITALFDNVLGPLSILETGGPTASLDIETRFLSGVLREAAPPVVVVTGRLRHRSRNYLMIEADLNTPDGRLIATATTRMVVAGQDAEKRA